MIILGADVFNIIIVVALVFLAGIFDGGEDAIKFKTERFVFKSDWWLIKGKYSPEKRTWLLKYIFSPLSDGWHYLKFWELICLILAIVVSSITLTQIWLILLLTLVLYFIRGLGFELAYQFLWVEPLEEDEKCK